MKFRIFRSFFIIVFLVFVIGAWGLAVLRFGAQEQRPGPIFSSEVLPAVMQVTPERKRLFALYRQGDSEFFIALSGTAVKYDAYVNVAKKLWALDGVKWFTGKIDDPHNLTFFSHNEAYYLGRGEGTKDFGDNLEKYLSAQLEKIKANGGDVVAQITADPLLLRQKMGNDAGYLNADGLFVVKDPSGVCGAAECFMLHGSLLTGFDGQELENEVASAVGEFKALGGRVVVSGGQSAMRSVAGGMVQDAFILLGSGLLMSLIVLCIMFKSIRPFLQMLIPFAVASFTACAAVCGVFGRIHLLTLVVAAPVWTLMLVFYMNFVISRLAVNDHRPHFTPVGWSLLILAGAYGLLTLCARHLFAEMAVFCVTALVVFTSYLYGPASFSKWLPLRTHRIFRFMASFMSLKLVRLGAIMLFLALVWISGQSLFSVMRVAAEARQGDVGTHAIGLDRSTFRTFLSGDRELTRYVVVGDNPEMTAQKVAAVERYLRKLQKDELLHRVIGYSGLLVTQKQAEDNFAFYKGLLPRALAFYRSQGIELGNEVTIERPSRYPLDFYAAGDFERTSRQVLDLSVKPAESIVTVAGMTPEGEAKFLAKFPECHSTDVVAELSHILNTLASEIVTVLCIFMAGSICLIFLVRGLTGVVCLAWPAVIGTGCAILVIRTMDLPYSIFTVTALVLVYAIGLISSVFLRRVRRLGEDRLMFCASVAFIISLFSYSSLLLSQAEGVRGMGIVLTSGLICATFSALFVDIVIAEKLKTSRFARLARIWRIRPKKNDKSEQTKIDR